PPGVEIYEIDGPFFFGAAEKFNDTLAQLGRRPRVLIVRMRNVPAIDSSGLHALNHLVERSEKEGTRVILAEVHAQPLIAITRHALGDRLGEAGIVKTLDEAVAMGDGV